MNKIDRAVALLFVALVVIVLLGGVITSQEMDKKTRSMQSGLMGQCKLAALGVDITHIQTLTGSSADLGSSEYKDIKALLIQERKAMPHASFMHILGMLPNGTVFIFANSELATSPNYSPPGQMYYEAFDNYDTAFAGNNSVRSITDRWGTWTTAMVPLRDPSTGVVVAVLCVGVDFTTWMDLLVDVGILPATASVLMASLVIVFFVMYRRRENERLNVAKASKAIQEANRKLSLLSTVTRHDINNQLIALMGYLKLLEKKQPTPLSQEHLQKAEAAASRISVMIQFTKEYEDIGVHAPVWQNVHCLLDRVAKEVTLGPVKVVNDLPPGTEIFADPLIQKVFFNLMDNAARHGGKITTIRFSIQKSDGSDVLVCEDDGNGVTRVDKERIFERGFGQNTGLGLFLVREILSITSITVTENGEPGRGARFVMVVPSEGFREPKMNG